MPNAAPRGLYGSAPITKLAPDPSFMCGDVQTAVSTLDRRAALRPVTATALSGYLATAITAQLADAGRLSPRGTESLPARSLRAIAVANVANRSAPVHNTARSDEDRTGTQTSRDASTSVRDRMQ
jgi:hypothetical protein